eukprot:2585297-Alexandrium_andersonii.AAC.1
MLLEALEVLVGGLEVLDAVVQRVDRREGRLNVAIEDVEAEADRGEEGLQLVLEVQGGDNSR